MAPAASPVASVQHCVPPPASEGKGSAGETGVPNLPSAPVPPRSPETLCLTSGPPDSQGFATRCSMRMLPTARHDTVPVLFPPEPFIQCAPQEAPLRLLGQDLGTWSPEGTRVPGLTRYAPPFRSSFWEPGTSLTPRSNLRLSASLTPRRTGSSG